MPPSLSPLRIRATARSVTQCIGVRLNETVTSDLEPEFRYQYDEPNDTYRELFTLLPLAMRTGQVTAHTKRAVLQRVVLRDYDSLARFFITVIKSPVCASYVKELHCYVDLSQYTSAERLNHDVARLSGISDHLDCCPISLDILVSIREHLIQQQVEGKPYRPALDIRFRQAMFLSLLAHLRNLHTLRMTIHGPAQKSLSWLRSEIIQQYPGYLVADVPCLTVCPFLHKVSFHAADDYRPSHIWHPLTLWPLIDLPEIEDLEIENNPTTWQGIESINNYPEPNDDDENDEENDEETKEIHDAFTYLRTLRIKNYLPFTHTLPPIFSCMTMLRTLAICGSSPLHDAAPSPLDAIRAATTKVNLNTLLSGTSNNSVASTLQYLSIDDACPTPQSAIALFGPSQRLTAGCLAGLTELRGLYIHSFALFGGVFAGRGSRFEEGGLPDGDLPFPVDMNAYEEAAVCLPARLERLEIVEDSYGGTRWTRGGQGTVEMGSSGKMTGLMKSFAGYCAQGVYPFLKHVVLWCQQWQDERYDWSGEDKEEVKGVFQNAGMEFECLLYERWPEGKVGGWRTFEGEDDDK
ncbi:hypothetical protein C8A00DRAFT_38160 [Chaetomidium leptoderma]|uniref:Uncharacterized protein n=1 Tax=Chaetomidium leptoderma TaxID=669021 RepID=A0AAN6VDU2_9PEZI|nr:hypothetical protein C8A00DRAFT_38160 [Chaetomidium leptoderma]